MLIMLPRMKLEGNKLVSKGELMIKKNGNENDQHTDLMLCKPRY